MADDQLHEKEQRGRNVSLLDLSTAESYGKAASDTLLNQYTSEKPRVKRVASLVNILGNPPSLTWDQLSASPVVLPCFDADPVSRAR